MHIYIYIYMYIYIYIYIYTYGRCTIPLIFDHPAIYKTSWREGETIALVYKYATTHTNTHFFDCILYYFIGFRIAPRVEARPSCVGGPILSNCAMCATSLRYSCSLSCLPPVPLGKRRGQGSLAIGGNPLLQRGIPYYRRYCLTI